MTKCPIMDEKSLKAKGQGSFDYVCDTVNNVVVCGWFDKKRVLLGSTYASVLPVRTCRRWDKVAKEFKEVPQPDIVNVYNQSMGGVDLMDMLVSMYSINFRSKKWYMRLFYRMIDISVANACLLYRRAQFQNDEPHIPLFDFKLELAKDMNTSSQVDWPCGYWRRRPSSLRANNFYQGLPEVEESLCGAAIRRLESSASDCG